MNMVFHHGALGDWVATFGVLRALAQQCATAAIAPTSKAKLAAAMIDGVEPLDIDQRDLTLLFAPRAAQEVGSAWRSRLERARLIVSFVSDGRDAWARNMAKLAVQAKVVFVDPRPGQDCREHVCDRYERLLRDQGVVLEYPSIEVRPNGGGPIVVHPGSGGRDKCWASDRFEKLVQLLRSGGQRVRVLIGEVELETWPAARTEKWVAGHGAEQIDSLEQLQGILRGARIYIGNDSGPTHLAAALGLTTIALFGPTNPAVWSPRGPAVRVVAPRQPAAMRWLSVETVLAAVRCYS